MLAKYHSLNLCNGWGAAPDYLAMCSGWIVLNGNYHVIIFLPICIIMYMNMCSACIVAVQQITVAGRLDHTIIKIVCYAWNSFICWLEMCGLLIVYIVSRGVQ